MPASPWRWRDRRFRPSSGSISRPASLIRVPWPSSSAPWRRAGSHAISLPHGVGASDSSVGRLGSAQRRVAARTREHRCNGPLGGRRRHRRMPAVQLEDSLRDVLDGTIAIVGLRTRKARAIVIDEQALEPEDAVHVEMVSSALVRGARWSGSAASAWAMARRCLKPPDSASTAARAVGESRASPRLGETSLGGARPRPNVLEGMVSPTSSRWHAGGERPGVLRDVAHPHAASKRATCRRGAAPRAPREDLQQRPTCPDPFGPTRQAWSPSNSPQRRGRRRGTRVPLRLRPVPGTSNRVGRLMLREERGLESSQWEPGTLDRLGVRSRHTPAAEAPFSRHPNMACASRSAR
jgi:hypothetical protein